MGHAVTAPKRHKKPSRAQIENSTARLREWASKRPTRAQIEKIAAKLREWAARVEQST
jgi:hypothetical protein